MKFTKRQLETVAALVDLPDFLVPWIDRFYDALEMTLILLLGQTELDAEDVRKRWTASGGDRLPDLDTFLERAFRKGVAHRDKNRRYRVADFHARYDAWALFEGWKDVPEDVRDTLNSWELAHYQSVCRSQIEELRTVNPRNTEKRWPEYLLPHEAEMLIDRVEQVYLWPCNCRSMIGRCRNPIYTCLRFSNNRGIGWEISKHRAKEILRDANRKGLMQNGEISIMPDGGISGAICNCCADCCFPHLLAEQLHAEKLWPLTRYVAQMDRDRCTACGRCVRRCPFDAFTAEYPDKSVSRKGSHRGREKPTIHFDPGLCRGCGVCSTGCKENAVTMVKLPGVEGLYDTLD